MLKSAVMVKDLSLTAMMATLRTVTAVMITVRLKPDGTAKEDLASKLAPASPTLLLDHLSL